MIILILLDVLQLESKKKGESVCTIFNYMDRYDHPLLKKYVHSSEILKKKDDFFKNKKKSKGLKRLLKKNCSYRVYNDFNTFLRKEKKDYATREPCHFVHLDDVPQNRKTCSSIGEYMIQFGSNILGKFLKSVIIGLPKVREKEKTSRKNSNKESALKSGKKQRFLQMLKNKKSKFFKRLFTKKGIDGFYKKFCNKIVPHYNKFNAVARFENLTMFKSGDLCNFEFVHYSLGDS